MAYKEFDPNFHGVVEFTVGAVDYLTQTIGPDWVSNNVPDHTLTMCGAIWMKIFWGVRRESVFRSLGKLAAVSTFLVVQFETPVLAATHVESQQQTSDSNTITIGMSAAFSGPAKALGLGMRHGIETYFDRVNANGGVDGRTLKLVARDDAYEPRRTAPNMRTLAQSGVFAVIGNVGTPTAAVAVPIINVLKLPMFGAFTGAGLLRKDPPDRYVWNFRASYAEETAEMVHGLIDVLGLSPQQIGFFTQNDATSLVLKASWPPKLLSLDGRSRTPNFHGSGDSRFDWQ